MKRVLFGLILLIIGQCINAQIDINKIIDNYWESVKIESNDGRFYILNDTEKSFLIFHKNGTFSFVFSLSDLKKTTKDKWKFDKRTQSFTLSSESEQNLSPVVFKVISVNEMELVLASKLHEKINKVYYKRIDDYK